MSIGRSLPRPFRGLLAIALIVVVADLASMGFAAAHEDDRARVIVPYSTTLVPTALNPGVDAYRSEPEALGLVAALGRLEDPGADGPVNARLRYALSALVGAKARGDRTALQTASDTVRPILESADEGLVRHSVQGEDPLGNALPANWVSAETQGLLLSVVSRLYVETDDEHWRRDADRVFATLLRFQGGRDNDDEPFEPWISFVDQYGFLWFEQFPQSPIRPSLTMAAHGTALLGIYDYEQIAQADRKESARLAFARGAGTTLQFSEQLPQKAGPAWTSIWQISRSSPRHRALEAQLRAFAAITGVPGFDDLATALMEGYAVFQGKLDLLEHQGWTTPEQAQQKARRLQRQGAW